MKRPGEPTLGEALDPVLTPGTVSAEQGGRRVEVDVEEVDRLGASVRGIRVTVPDPAETVEQARRLPEALRPLPEDVVPVEVDRALGGSVLRTRPSHIVDREFFEVRTRGDTTSIERRRAGPDGWEPRPFTMTREQLRRIVDAVGDAIAEAPEEP